MKHTAARRTGLLLVCLLSLLVPATAHASPEFSGTVTSASPFTWNGGPKSGPPVGNLARWEYCHDDYANPAAGDFCDEVLLDVKESGKLTVAIRAGKGSEDLDVRVFKSDKDGNYDPVLGTEEAVDAETGASAKVTIDATPGFYIALVRFYTATDGVYTGTASFPAPAAAAPAETPAAPQPAQPSQQPAQPQPAQQQPKPKRKSASCKAKAKKIKNAKKRKAALKRCSKAAKKKKKR